MLPSVGSISMPADVPHFLPSGSLPQFGVVTGTGFGSPAPVIGFPITIALAVPESGEHPASRAKMEAKSVKVRTGRKDMGEDMVASLSRSRLPQNIPVRREFH